MKKLEDILRGLVLPCLQSPDHLEVYRGEGDTVAIYHLRVAKCDYGRIIGKGGGNVTALKTLFVAAGLKRGINARLVLSESGHDGYRDPRWTAADVVQGVFDLLEALGYPPGVCITEHGKPGEFTMLTEAILPEILHESLARWLLVMSHEGNVRLTLDEPTAA